MDYVPHINNVVNQNIIIDNNIQSLREQYSTDDQKNRHAISINEYISNYQIYIFYCYYIIILLCFLYIVYKRKLHILSLLGILFFITLPHILFFIETIIYYYLDKYFLS